MPVDIGAVKKVYNDRQMAGGQGGPAGQAAGPKFKKGAGPGMGQGQGLATAPGQMKPRSPRIPPGSMQRAMQRRQAAQPKPQPVEQITRYAPQPGQMGGFDEGRRQFDQNMGAGAPMQALPVGTPTAFRPMMPPEGQMRALPYTGGAPMQAQPVGFGGPAPDAAALQDAYRRKMEMFNADRGAQGGMWGAV